MKQLIQKIQKSKVKKRNQKMHIGQKMKKWQKKLKCTRFKIAQ